jgi:Putative quorum-sensing-regulated virulence factor
MTYRMPFGQHKGTPVADLPDDYLAWLRTIDLREPLASIVEEEWEDRRAPRQRFIAGSRLPDDLKSLAADIIQHGYRQAALRHHPDHGGQTLLMQRLNAAHTWLRRHVLGKSA